MKRGIKLALKPGFTVLFLWLQFAALGQIFPVIKHNDVALKPFDQSATIVFDLDSVQLYFDKSVMTKYLKKQLRTRADSNISFLLNTIKINPVVHVKNHLVFDQRTGNIDKNDSQNIYQLAIAKVVANILIDGKVAIYDSKNHLFIHEIHITQDQTLDFLGYREFLKFFFPDDRLFYTKEIRKTVDGKTL